MRQNEIWLPSASFPAYEVSDQGRVRRRGQRRCLTPFFYRGHYSVAVSNPRNQAVPIATLVAEAFCGLPSARARQRTHRIIHRNDDPTDNRPQNLLVTLRASASSLDLLRASRLAADGVPARMIHQLTGVRLKRCRKLRAGK